MRAAMLEGEPQFLQPPGDHRPERNTRQRTKGRTHGQKEFPASRSRPHFLWVADDRFSYALAQRKQMASKQLGTREDYRLAPPIDVAELQTGDLSGTHTIDREQHQDRAITDGCRLVASSGGQYSLHIIPGWPRRERLVLKHAWGHDCARNTCGTPISH